MEMCIMKKLITWQDDILKKLKLILVFFYFLFQTSNIFASERWVLDKSLSTIEFELPVLFAKNVKGQFNTIEGFVELDVEKKENNKAIFSVQIDDLEMNYIKYKDLLLSNIFFIKDKISGVIDFYFSCDDFIAYELALAINAWCFDFEDGFKEQNYISLMEGFNEYSSLDESEKKSLNVLLRGAAVRILVTRLHDMIYHPKDALVIPKNPKEYLQILEWHQENPEINL